MTYGEAINTLNQVRNGGVTDAQILAAIQKIQDMTTINAIRKETLMDVIDYLLGRLGEKTGAEKE